MKHLKKLLTVALAALLLLALVACDKAVSVTGARVDENGDLIITMSDGSTQNAGKVIGPQGEKGDKGDSATQSAENPQGLDFYLLPDGTWSVSAGKAFYAEEIVIPAEFEGKPVTCIGALPEVVDDAMEMGSISAGFACAPFLKTVIDRKSVV